MTNDTYEYERILLSYYYLLVFQLKIKEEQNQKNKKDESINWPRNTK